MKNRNSYKGFSLAEALILLVIIAICGLLVPKVMVKKHARAEYENHGTWECEMYGGSYTQTLRDKDGKIKDQKTPTGGCTFVAPVGAKDFNMDICGNHAELGICNYYDGSHVLKYYPTLKKVPNIQIRGDRVYFGDYAFAFHRGGLARVLLVF